MTPAAFVALAAACLAVEGDRITTADLARAWPGWSASAGAEVVGYAPSAGATRRFTGAELRRLAAKYGLAGEPPESLCVVRDTAALEPDRIVAAMRETFPEADIELSDWTRAALPRGRLEFPRSGLQPPAPGREARLWRGRLLQDGGRRLPVWARVRLRVNRVRVVARVPLPAGQAIEASQLRLERTDAPSGAAREAASFEQVAGKVPRRAIREGAPVELAALDEPPVVRRGEKVAVLVESGAARLALDALAVEDGYRGRMVRLRNPENGRQFAARVEGPGRAVVSAGKVWKR